VHKYIISMRCNLVVVLALLVLSSSLCIGKLNCPSLPPHTAKDIYDLRPNDIKVVIALGDSITAAFGLLGNAGEMNEFRGQSYSIGGDDNATTIPNFLSTYVPNIIGAAKGHHILEYCPGAPCPDFQYHPAIDVFNAAQSGAMAINLPLHQLGYLIPQIAKHPEIDLENDWKLLTILIGANDICEACVNSNLSYTTPDAFEQYLMQTLQKVQTSLPRTFVNLILGFNLSEVYNLASKSLYCEAHERIFAFECACLFNKTSGPTTRAFIDQLTQQYNERVYRVANYWSAQKYAGFAVVVQPFLHLTTAKDLPLSFLSDFDCFHPSLFAHENLAIALWNSMLTPAEKKKTSLNLNDTPICPTADTLLYTY